MHRTFLVYPDDRKYSLDFYLARTDTGLSLKNDYHTMVNYINSNFPENMGMRAYPFVIAQCPNCSQKILTNRKQGKQVKCKICNDDLTIKHYASLENNNLLGDFEKEINIKKINLNGKIGYILFVVPKSTSEDLKTITNFLTNCGYQEAEKNTNFKFLLFQLISRGLFNHNASLDDILFFQIKLDNDDVEYLGQIERFEDIALSIRNLINNPGIISVSMAVEEESLYKKTDKEIEQFLHDEIQANYLDVDNRIVLGNYYCRIGDFAKAYEEAITVQNIDAHNVAAEQLLLRIKLAQDNLSVSELEYEQLSDFMKKKKTTDMTYTLSEPEAKWNELIDILKSIDQYRW